MRSMIETQLFAVGTEEHGKEYVIAISNSIHCAKDVKRVEDLQKQKRSIIFYRYLVEVRMKEVTSCPYASHVTLRLQQRTVADGGRGMLISAVNRHGYRLGGHTHKNQGSNGVLNP